MTFKIFNLKLLYSEGFLFQFLFNLFANLIAKGYLNYVYKLVALIFALFCSIFQPKQIAYEVQLTVAFGFISSWVGYA